MKKNNSIFNIIITVLFTMAIFILGIWQLIEKDISFSQDENRILQERPKLSLTNIADGSFMQKIEKYFSDQFPLRNESITIKTQALRTIGRTKINNVFINSDGYMMADAVKENEKDLLDKLNAINEFSIANDKMNITTIFVPNSITVLDSKLSIYADYVDQIKQISEMNNRLDTNIKKIDAYDILKNHDKEYIYYKTDHHWTTTGAFYVMQEYARANELDYESIVYKQYDITNTFEGTLTSKVGLHLTTDIIKICVPQSDSLTYSAYYVNEKIKKTTMFDIEKLANKDKYELFFGGNYAQINITTNVKTGKRLLIFKDSFANCFIPMLTPYYDEIVVIDPRFFYGNINDVIKQYKFTDTLFLYNINTFLEDTELVDTILNR